MKNLAAKGTSIIMISSELPEVLGMSDRVVVMQEGKIAKILKNDDTLTQEKIMYYATSELREENSGKNTRKASK
jgi:ABC-type sugar transport system ATPase subunit